MNVSLYLITAPSQGSLHLSCTCSILLAPAIACIFVVAASLLCRCFCAPAVAFLHLQYRSLHLEYLNCTCKSSLLYFKKDSHFVQVHLAPAAPFCTYSALSAIVIDCLSFQQPPCMISSLPICVGALCTFPRLHAPEVTSFHLQEAACSFSSLFYFKKLLILLRFFWHNWHHATPASLFLHLQHLIGTCNHVHLVLAASLHD